MRILIISFVFPPHNIIGAVRVGKTAKYLVREGHDVRVLAGKDLDIAPSLALEIPAENVIYTRWSDVDRPYRALLSARNRIKHGLAYRISNGTGTDPVGEWSVQQFGSVGPQSERRRLSWRLRLLYADLFHLPDSAVGWRRHALRAGRELATLWPPDVILASGAPWTSLVVAHDLAARLGVPWVAELRDLWSGNHTTFISDWRKRTVDSWYEARVLRTASGLVTVSEPLAAKLRARYPEQRVDVVLNGFDEEDYVRIGVAERSGRAQTAASNGPASPAGDTLLRLVYTGEINRDLRPLLDGIRLLASDASYVRLEIVGPQSPAVQARYVGIADAYGIADTCVWKPPVSHAEASGLQQAADVLVLLLHDSPNDAGVYTGKLFEYVGARRPILLAGTTSGVAAELVRERGLGYAESLPERIAARLRNWIREKRERGAIAAPPGESVDDLSRASQTRRYAAILARVTAR